MTDNENVASSEEAQENRPVPNPYNLKKSWHTDDVMPTGGVETADSLFVDLNLFNKKKRKRATNKKDQKHRKQNPIKGLTIKKGTMT